MYAKKGPNTFDVSQSKSAKSPSLSGGGRSIEWMDELFKVIIPIGPILVNSVARRDVYDGTDPANRPAQGISGRVPGATATLFVPLVWRNPLR